VAAFGRCLVNLLLTISIKVNVPFCGMSRIVTTGDDHEEQESELDPGPLVVAVRQRLERCRRQRLSDFRSLRPDYRRKLDDLRLGADRLSACAVRTILAPARSRHQLSAGLNIRWR